MPNELGDVPLEDLTQTGRDPVQDMIMRLMQSRAQQEPGGARMPSSSADDLIRMLLQRRAGGSLDLSSLYR